MNINANNYEAIIIGGGVIGQSIARELALEGMEVLLIYPYNHGRDSATLAAGALIGAFSELTQGSFDPMERKKLEFRIHAQEMHPDWLDQLRQESQLDVFTTQGIFMIANRSGQRDRTNLQQLKVQLDAYYKRSEWVHPADVPGLNTYDGYEPELALLIHDDFTVDSEQLMAALNGAIQANPYATVLDDRVLSVDANKQEKDWTVKTTKNGSISAPNVIVCTGARVPATLGEATLPRLHLPVLYFAKGIGCTVTGSPHFPHAIRTPNRSDACGVHIVPRTNHRLYIGASTHYGYATIAARGITPGEITAILGDTIREINRTLRDTTLKSTRFGLRPLAMDELPLVGKTMLPGLFLATATFRTGIVMAPLIAKVVSSEVLDREPSMENPWRADEQRCYKKGKVDENFDANVAYLYVNRGLNHFYRAKCTGNQHELEQALVSWRMYAYNAGNYADPRILDLITRLEKGEDTDDIW